MMEVRPLAAEQVVDDAPPDVPHIGGTLTEVFVVDAGEHVRLLGGHAVDRLGRRRPLVDRGHCRLDDPGIGGEERLGLENRPGLVSRPARGLQGEGRQLRGGRREGGLQPHLFRLGVAGPGSPGCGDRRHDGRGRRQPEQPPDADAGGTRSPGERCP